AFFFLDHDQRVTFTAGSELNLPDRFWLSDTVVFGSGFLKGDGPDHMPRHTTLDLALCKDLGENWSLRWSALNVTNSLFLTGLDISFAGTHYAAPRENFGASALSIPLLMRLVLEFISWISSRRR